MVVVVGNTKNAIDIVHEELKSQNEESYCLKKHENINEHANCIIGIKCTENIKNYASFSAGISCNDS